MAYFTVVTVSRSRLSILAAIKMSDRSDDELSADENRRERFYREREDTPPPRARRDPPENRPPRGHRRICYKCNGYGHVAYMCPSREDGDHDLKCFRCGGEGTSSMFAQPPGQGQKGQKEKKEENPPKNGNGGGKNVFYIHNH
ncbi:uncharacterized protein LOC144636541 [Oculina patagonica]